MLILWMFARWRKAQTSSMRMQIGAVDTHASLLLQVQHFGAQPAGSATPAAAYGGVMPGAMPMPMPAPGTHF